MAAKAEQQVQPKFSQSQVVEVVKRLYRLTPSEIRLLPSYIDQNFHVIVREGGEYILKIVNSDDSKNPTMIAMQTRAMSFLHQRGLPTQTALANISGELMSLEEADCGHGCQRYLVRMLTYLPGTIIAKVPLTPLLLFETGKMAAEVDNILQEFEDPHLSEQKTENVLWNLSNLPLLEEYTYVLDGDSLQEVVKSVIHEYKSYVVPKLSDFRKCIIHGDLHGYNILAQPDESDGHRISGLLDFGDMTDSYFIFELAITILHMMMNHPNPIEAGRHVLTGWESVLALNETERDCLYVLVLSRLCLVLILTRQAMITNPEKTEYLMQVTKNDVHILHQLRDLGKEQVEKVWF